MKLTEHFSLEELIVTSVRGIDNTPPSSLIATLEALAFHLETVRAVLGKPIIVTSGYRSSDINRFVGGSKNSAHMRGEAVDFICPDFGTPLDVCRAIVAAGVPFDQLIEENDWIHIAFSPAMRGDIRSKGPGGVLVAGLPETAKEIV